MVSTVTTRIILAVTNEVLRSLVAKTDVTPTAGGGDEDEMRLALSIVSRTTYSLRGGSLSSAGLLLEQTFSTGSNTQ